ncbi:MAG: GNAT family N-acetyltransferase [Myxococcota bacterium]
MRRAQLARPSDEGLSVLDVAPFAHLAWVDVDGKAQLRSVHALRFDGEIIFHGAKASALAKEAAKGRAPLVTLQAEQVLAPIPSYFIDPERACPATTLYRSVQVEGRLEPHSLSETKAAALTALMERFQPEGGYAPLSPQADIYRGEIKGVAVTRLVPEKVSARANLAQSKPLALKRQLIEALWARGAPGDLEAIERMRAVSEEDPAPEDWGAGPARFHVWATSEDAEAVAAPLTRAYWNEGIPASDLIAAHLAATAWVLARGPQGDVVASARAVSDDTKHAWIYDVWVEPELRHRGIATQLIRILLDHPRMRRVRFVHLQTKDAQALYRRLGFDEAPLGVYPHMMRRGSGAA